MKRDFKSSTVTSYLPGEYYCVTNTTTSEKSIKSQIEDYLDSYFSDMWCKGMVALDLHSLLVPVDLLSIRLKR